MVKKNTPSETFAAPADKPLLVKFTSTVSSRGIPRSMVRALAQHFEQPESWVIYSAVARMHMEVWPELYASGELHIPEGLQVKGATDLLPSQEEGLQTLGDWVSTHLVRSPKSQKESSAGQEASNQSRKTQGAGQAKGLPSSKMSKSPRREK